MFLTVLRVASAAISLCLGTKEDMRSGTSSSTSFANLCSHFFDDYPVVDYAAVAKNTGPSKNRVQLLAAG